MIRNGPDSQTVEIGFEHGMVGPSAVAAWTDVTDRLLAASSGGGGKKSFLDRPATPATLSFTLLDHDGNLTRWHSGSPYAAGLDEIIGTPIRWTVTEDGVTTGLGFGHITAWEPVWEMSGAGQVPAIQVEAIDPLRLASLRPLPSSFYACRQLQSSPTVYLRFAEDSTATTAMDDSGNALHGTYSGSVTPGSSTQWGGVTIDRSVAQWALGAGRVLLPAQAAPTGTAWSVEAYVQSIEFGAPARDMWRTIISWFDGAAGCKVQMNAAGFPVVTVTDGADTTTVTGTTSLWGNRGTSTAYWRHVTVTRSAATLSLYVDGVLQATGDVTAVAANRPAVVSVGGAPWGASATGWVGAIAELALFDTTLSGATVADHVAALDPTLTIDVWVSEVLDTLGWTLADFEASARSYERVYDPSWGGDSLDMLTDLAYTNDARLFVDGDGTVRLTHRHDQLASSSVATFGDGPGEIPYLGDSLQVADDDRELYTEATGTRSRGVTQTWKDDTAAAKFGYRTTNIDILDVGSDRLVLSRAQWAVARSKTPRTRIEQFTVVPWHGGGHWPDMLALRAGHLITVRRRPPGRDMFETNAAIEGLDWAFDIRSTPAWTVTVRTSTVGPQTYWILGDAVRGVLGSTTRLAY